jgi:hypothetical protein
MRAAFLLKDRSDQELLDGVFAAITREFEDVALVVAHIAEMGKRKLFAGEGCSSLKTYCMEVLHLTEDQAYSRIAVARVARKFPVVLDMLADGLVHLTAVDRLGPSLTQENHLAILEEATFKSMAQVEEIVARLRPKPPVPSSIRKLGSSSGQDEGGEGFFGSGTAGGPDEEAREEHVPPSRARRSAISPLAPASHDIHITADEETVYALRELQELLSHQVPNGDPAVIIKHSLLRTLKEVKKERFGTGKRRKNVQEESSARAEIEEERFAKEASTGGTTLASQEGPRGTPGKALGGESQSRYIPKEIRKAVWERDQGRCAFRSIKGRWCTERRFLEFHHIIPFAWRGETTVDNIELRCRTHNAYEGDLIFGKVLRRSDPKCRLAAGGTGFETSASHGTEMV